MPHFVELPIDGIRFFGRRPHVFEAQAIQNEFGLDMLTVKGTAYPVKPRVLLQTGRYMETEGPARLLAAFPTTWPVSEYEAEPGFYIEVFASDRMDVIYPAEGGGYQVFQASASGGYLDLIEWFGNPALTRLWYSPTQYLKTEGPARVLGLADYQVALNGPLQEAKAQKQASRLLNV